MPPADDTIARSLERSGIGAMLRRDNPALWQETARELSYRPVSHSGATIDYQHAYFSGQGWDVHDLSLVLINDSRPCGLWPLALGGPPSAPRLHSSGGPITAPALAQHLAEKTLKRLCTRAIDFARNLCDEFHVADPVFEQPAAPEHFGPGLSEWHQQLLTAGGIPTVRYDLFADLRPPIDKIFGAFRKSYRPLVTSGLRTWTPFICEAESARVDVWNEFQLLHQAVAGRVTRGDDTWHAQYAMIVADEALLVGLRDPIDGRLVGGGFFQYTSDEALYAVGAYDRSLFDKPVGHVVQRVAMEALKSRGIRWYRLGARHYAQDTPTPTEKELSIAEFKQGFASHIVPRYEFRLPVSANTERSLAE